MFNAALGLEAFRIAVRNGQFDQTFRNNVEQKQTSPKIEG
jgi:nitrogen fixation-related uncharacterized protein